MDIKKGLNGKVKVRGGDNGDPTKMTEREFAVASLVQRAMKGAMAAIKLVLKLDREAESAERAAARAFEESQPKRFEWTEEHQTALQEFEEAMKQIEEADQRAGSSCCDVIDPLPRPRRGDESFS